MGYTPYSKTNRGFSDKAHLAALKEIYPKIGKPVNCVSCSVCENIHVVSDYIDMNFGIDKIIKIGNYTYSFQERFREDKFRHYNDITITESNPNSGKQGELYKMAAQYFVYGYFDGTNFTEWVIVDLNKLYNILRRGRKIGKVQFINERTGQTALAITIKELFVFNIITWRK